MTVASRLHGVHPRTPPQHEQQQAIAASSNAVGAGAVLQQGSCGNLCSG